MDDRLKKNPKNELLEDIRKIVKEEIEKFYISYSPIYIYPEPLQPYYERPYYTNFPNRIKTTTTWTITL